MAQQYSLKWNNHQPNFISMFAMLRNTQALVDVTLAAEGRHLHAHKMVLSACSPYFHSLFMENPSQHPIVILKDVSFSDLRTIVDFMYYGEVNITQEELPQMLHSAKSLKVKGLTETESTSVMRSHSSDFPFEAPGEPPGDQSGEPSGRQGGEQLEPSEQHNDQGDHDPRKRSLSPNNSPSSKRRRRRRSSNGSTSINMVGEDPPNDSSLEIGREGITLSSVPRRREFPQEDNHAGQQNSEAQNISMEDMHVEHGAPGMPQGGQWSMMEHSYPRYTNACFGGGALGGEGGSGNAVGGGGLYMGELMAGLRLRRAKYLMRQPAVEELTARRQVSEPMHAIAPIMPPQASAPPLRKHNSYPQFPSSRNRGPRSTQSVDSGDQLVSDIMLRAAAATERHSPVPTARASHTPAIRSGPPLSCNFCWNTVDEFGRILRRKTQYHCPECRTNLCIVPCFHQYHEVTAANAR